MGPRMAAPGARPYPSPMTLLLLGLARADCPPMDRLLERATTEIISGSFDAAATTLSDAERAMACQPMAESDIGRYWMVQGARLAVTGQDAQADACFAAARRVAPGVWDARFGRALMARFDGAVETGRATIEVDTRQDQARIDGRPAEVWPAPVSSGWHLVQVVEEEVLYSRLLQLAPGENARVATRLPEPALATAPGEPEPLPEAVEPRPKKKSPALLIAAGTAAALGGGCAGLSVTEGAKLEGSDSLGQLESRWTANRGFAYGAYGLWGLAGAGVVLHFVLP